MLVECIVGVVAHELGHVAATLARGLKVRGVRLSFKRLAIVADAGRPIDQVWIAAAGPVVNFALALAFRHHADFVEVNLILGGLNLLPLSGFDGRRIVDGVYHTLLHSRT